MDHRAVDYRRLAELRWHIRRFLSFSEGQARSVGLAPQQHQLLLAIRGARGGESTVGELADRLLVRHHSAGELVDRLESRGLAARRRGAPDHRQVLVRLTARGERLLARLTQAHLDELGSTGPELARTLSALLSRHRKEERGEEDGKRTTRGPSRPAHSSRRPRRPGAARRLR